MKRTPDEFKEWVRTAEVGDRLLYMQADYAQRVPDLAKAAMEAAEQGEVFLSQKKIGVGVYNFYATRVSKKTGRVIKPWDGK
jgi:hypothetical protein